MIKKEAVPPMEGQEPVEAPVAPAAPAPMSPMAKIKGLLAEATNLIAEMEAPEEVEGEEVPSADLGSQMAGAMEMPMKKGMK